MIQTYQFLVGGPLDGDKLKWDNPHEDGWNPCHVFFHRPQEDPTAWVCTGPGGVSSPGVSYHAYKFSEVRPNGDVVYTYDGVVVPARRKS